MFKLNIDTPDDTFSSLAGVMDLASVLQQATNRVRNGMANGDLYDRNGQIVGHYEWRKSEET